MLKIDKGKHDLPQLVKIITAESNVGFWSRFWLVTEMIARQRVKEIKEGN